MEWVYPGSGFEMLMKTRGRKKRERKWLCFVVGEMLSGKEGVESVTNLKIISSG